jgi:nucleoside 2-deoxyribosyltransferase
MNEPKNQLRAAVSGSFHRHMEAITRAVHELAALSVRVLSPADPRIVAAQGEFLFVASDRVRSVRLVQDRHLESIRAADFLWLVCPDGYVGQSASMELGYAAAKGIPLFATRAPSDLTLREYVSIVRTLSDAVRRVEAIARPRHSEGLLIDPHASVAEAHDILERIKIRLTRENGLGDAASRIYHDVADLQTKIGLPTYIQ